MNLSYICKQIYCEKDNTMIQASIIAGFLGGYEWIIILLAIVLMFGGKKIPELMRGLGKGIREFKDSSKEIKEESEETDSKEKSE
jgi:sec-independent protein translocase protein TatA